MKSKNLLNLYKKNEPDRYTKLEPKLLEISNSLFANGILEKKFYSDFNESFSDLSFFIQTLRNQYNNQYGFFLVNEDFLEISSVFLKNKKVLEVGAGSGFLSKCLSNKDINITPIDLKLTNNLYGFKERYCNIIEADAVKYLKQNKNIYDTVLMSWPNYDNNFATNILKQMMPGQTLVYIGESYGGCTANDSFFELLKEKCKLNHNQTETYATNHVSWPYIHDRVYVYDIIK